MMTEEEFYEYFSQCDLDSYIEQFWIDYQKARRYDALENFGVDNWIWYDDAMESLKNPVL